MWFLSLFDLGGSLHHLFSYVYLLTSWPAYLLTSWPAYLLTSWPAYLLTSWPAYLLTSWPAYLLTSWPAYLLTSWPADLLLHGLLCPQSNSVMRGTSVWSPLSDCDMPCKLSPIRLVGLHKLGFTGMDFRTAVWLLTVVITKTNRGCWQLSSPKQTLAVDSCHHQNKPWLLTAVITKTNPGCWQLSSPKQTLAVDSCHHQNKPWLLTVVITKTNPGCWQLSSTKQNYGC